MVKSVVMAGLASWQHCKPACYHMSGGIYVANNKGSHSHANQQHDHEIWEWEVCLRNKGWGI